MYLCITGFLRNDCVDDSLKFKLYVDQSYNERIVSLLGHSSLNAMAEGLWDLTEAQSEEISHLTGEKLPDDLALLIGAEA